MVETSLIVKWSGILMPFQNWKECLDFEWFNGLPNHMILPTIQKTRLNCLVFRWFCLYHSKTGQFSSVFRYFRCSGIQFSDGYCNEVFKLALKNVQIYFWKGWSLISTCLVALKGMFMNVTEKVKG